MTIDGPAMRTGATRELLEPVAPEPTVGQLVASASEDISALVRAEIALAKAEVSFSAKQAGLGGAFFGVAGYLAFLASILLTIAAAYGLIAAGVWPWLAFLIVALVFLLLAGIFALLGKRRFGRVKAPERTIRTAQETLAAVKPGR